MNATGPPSAFEVILVPIENLGELSRLARCVKSHSLVGVDVTLRQAFELCVEVAAVNACRLKGGQLRLAQFSAKWMRGSPNFERIIFSSNALKLVCWPATVIRLPVKKVKSASFTLLVGYFSERLVQNPGVVGVEVKSELLPFFPSPETFSLAIPSTTAWIACMSAALLFHSAYFTPPDVTYLPRRRL